MECSDEEVPLSRVKLAVLYECLLQCLDHLPLVIVTMMTQYAYTVAIQSFPIYQLLHMLPASYNHLNKYGIGRALMTRAGADGWVGHCWPSRRALSAMTHISNRRSTYTSRASKHMDRRGYKANV